MTIARQRTFLTAEWKNLLMLNYAVDPALLQPFVPAGTELDEHDGKTWMSLIGFEFNKTHVLGMAIPFHQSFEEVNLRFYVRRMERRGVVFISELVPKYAVTAIARFVYGERYSCVKMAHQIDSNGGTTTARVLVGIRFKSLCDFCRDFWRPLLATGGFAEPVHHRTLLGICCATSGRHGGVPG